MRDRMTRPAAADCRAKPVTAAATGAQPLPNAVAAVRETKPATTEPAAVPRSKSIVAGDCVSPTQPTLVVRRRRLAAMPAPSAIAATTPAKSAFRAASARAGPQAARAHAQTTPAAIPAIRRRGSKTAATRAACLPLAVAATMSADLAAAVLQGRADRSPLDNPIAARAQTTSAMASNAASPS